ncbi:ATP-dependent DNA helicase, partial [bacterium]|nr:ATP-dependent DNA helicase [bacterium]
ETFAAAHSGICMSATLSPLDASGQLLGLPDKHEQLKLPSPFPSENLYVRIDAGVTTLYRQRPENIQPLAGRIERFYAHCHCNAIAFFPSFELMRQIVEHLDIPDILVQEIQMKDQERVDMLQKFKQSSHTLLCCVMGGIFAEGIDLPGKWAEAALIVGVGLPAICLENDLLRAYFDRKGENGFNFAYLYPGLQRVVQAAGRIIRTPSDRGVVLLLDHRYAESAYHRLLPESWFKSSRESGVDQFWDEEIASFINQR